MLCSYSYRDIRFGTRKEYQCEVEDFKNFWKHYDDKSCLMWCCVKLANGRYYWYHTGKWR